MYWATFKYTNILKENSEMSKPINKKILREKTTFLEWIIPCTQKKMQVKQHECQFRERIVKG